MSKFVENISVLQNNTFILTPLLVSFYKNMKPTDKNILLAYFVFPLVLNKEFLNNIQQFNKKSNLNRITSNKNIMAGFEERFDYYKEQTNMCLQYAIDSGYIEVDDNLRVTVIYDDNRFIAPQLIKSNEMASKLYRVFTKDVVNTYYEFGIKKL